MVPIPAVLSPLARTAWQRRVNSATNNARSPRWKEFAAQKSATVAVDGGTRTFTYRELKLAQGTAAYNEVKRKLDGWKSHWGEKPSFDDLITLKYTVDASRANPGQGTGDPLYIALHGGGGIVQIQDPVTGQDRPQTLAEAKASNDQYWIGMQDLYKGAIKRGLYVATRGLGESWDMHFTSASYVLMERLIENMILFQGVDSNQVYLIGFSAGGDGVYRLATRLSQRFGAVNMGGGDPGLVKFENFMNTPICLQVGEQDRNYGRCEHVAESGEKLDRLQEKYPKTLSVYEHDVFIHPTGPVPKGTDDYVWRHFSGWEAANANLASPGTPRKQLPIVKDYVSWLKTYPKLAPSSNVTSRNTNAIDWVNAKNARKSLPQRVIWDLSEGPENYSAPIFDCTSGRGESGHGRSQNYWLDINQYSGADVGDLIEAWIDKSKNAVVVVSAKKYLRILLRHDMLNLSQKVDVQIAGRTLPVQVDTENPAVVQDTLVRNDPNLIFTGDIVLTQEDGGTWSARTTPKTPSKL